MNISHKQRYLYFVVPKSASKTLRQTLAPYTDIGYPVSVYEQHMTVDAFAQTEHASLMEDYFKFTFVRNPYDRLYSGYMQDRRAATKNVEWGKVKGPIFESIGDNFNRYLLEHAARASDLTTWDWVCFTPMEAFACQKGEYVLDWFGRAESFEDDLDVLSRKLNVSLDKIENQNVNVPPQKGLKYLDKYSREAVEWVNETYAGDFERFGYERLDASQFSPMA